MKKIFLLLTICVCISGFSQYTESEMYVVEDIEIIRINENVLLHRTYKMTDSWGRVSANGLIYINKKKAFLLDTPWNTEQTESLVTWLEDSLKLKMVGFIPIHWHEDSMEGLSYLKSKKIKSYANQLTIDIAKEKDLPQPEIGFSDSLSLKLGNNQILCYFPGAAHTLDNIVIWLPDEEILFAGCVLKGLDFNNLGFTGDGDIEEYPATLNRVLNRFSNAKIVVPGHGDYGGIEIIHHNLKFLK